MTLKLVSSLDTVAECLKRRRAGARLMRSGSEVPEDLLISLLPAHVTWEKNDLESDSRWEAFDLVDADGQWIDTAWIRQVDTED